MAALLIGERVPGRLAAVVIYLWLLTDAAVAELTDDARAPNLPVPGHNARAAVQSRAVRRSRRC